MTNKSQQIAVLGGGIMGLMNAYMLSRAGYSSLTLYDPDGFGAENASYKAGGMLAPYSEIEHMDGPWVQAGLASIDVWRDVQAEFGADFDFHARGSLFVAHRDDRYILERFREHLPEGSGVSVAVQDLEPAIAGRFANGLYLEREAHLHPKMVMGALRSYLAERIQVRREAVEPSEIKADLVLDCRGMGAVSQDPDLRGVTGELAVVRNPEFSLSRPVRLMHPRYPLYIVPRPDHVFMIGATVIEADAGDEISVRSGMELMSALYSLHPSFGEAKLLEFSAGVRPSYADNLPALKRQGNVISCNGLFRHGFLFSPVMARCVLALIQGGRAEFHDLLVKDDDNGRDDGGYGQRAA